MLFMRVINIIKDIQPIRMGVFTAATNTASYLFNKHNVLSELWFPGSNYGNTFKEVESVSLPDRGVSFLKKMIKERDLCPNSDIIVTHSPWSYQSGWGYDLAQQGFKWIFVAHGTLQPTYLAQKWLKKKIYYELVEKRLLSKVSIIRAISEPEKNNLQKKFPDKKIVVIPNGYEILSAERQVKKENWFSKSSFFILPSIGEGFPVSVTEAAGRGLIPVITEGCNFPEILENGLAVKTGINSEEIKSSVELCGSFDEYTIQKMSNKVIQFMKGNYSIEIIAEKKYEQ